MSSKILLFPGQGSQYVGMGESLLELPAARHLWEQSSDILGFDLVSTLLNGPEEELKKTENTQPALFLVSMMALEALKEQDITWDYVAGHSLGEYSALCAAGVFSFEDGLKLVRLRGELMAKAGESSPGAMSALLGLDANQVQDIVEKSQSVGTVVVANYNSPGQIVISGEVEGVAKAEEVATAMGAKKVVRLPVSGAFHSPLMAFAQAGLGEGLEQVSFTDPKVPVIANVNADTVTSGEQLKGLLLEQLVSSVRWTESIEKAVQLGVSEGFEVGAGKVLKGLVRSISRDLKVTPVESLEAAKGI
jgi:[acyl-carrier-protein] S-malonyltransferase